MTSFALGWNLHRIMCGKLASPLYVRLSIPAMSSRMQAAGDSSCAPAVPCSGPALAWGQLSPHQELPKGLRSCLFSSHGFWTASLLEDKES